MPRCRVLPTHSTTGVPHASADQADCADTIHLVNTRMATDSPRLSASCAEASTSRSAASTRAAKARADGPATVFNKSAPQTCQVLRSTTNEQLTAETCRARKQARPGCVGVPNQGRNLGRACEFRYRIVHFGRRQPSGNLLDRPHRPGEAALSVRSSRRWPGRTRTRRPRRADVAPAPSAGRRPPPQAASAKNGRGVPSATYSASRCMISAQVCAVCPRSISGYPSPNP